MSISSKMWGGRFRVANDEKMERYSSSLRYDYRLLSVDVEASIAHARMLAKCGFLTPLESKSIVRGLQAVERELSAGRPDWTALKYEDIHSLVQDRLARKIGKAAQKLHTARSRNDQVVTDVRLYCLRVIKGLKNELTDLQRTVLKKAHQYQGVVTVGMTHLKPAQPILLAHQFLSYLEMLERDKERLSDTYRGMDSLPLGSGALAGTTLNIDRRFVAKALGFSRISQNSLDAVGDRDFAVELIFDLALLGAHLSRIAEDLLIGQLEGVGIFVLSEKYCTGSSMMPQKKNPDALELIRGGTGVFYGHLTSILTTLKGLPSSYQRDLQWDKKPLFESIELAKRTLCVLNGLLGELEIDAQAIQRTLKDESIYATDLAEYLVRRGVPFQESHRVVGRLVVYAQTVQRPLSSLSIDEFKKFKSSFGEEVYELFDPMRSVSNKRSQGSTCPADVQKQLAAWVKRLK